MLSKDTFKIWRKEGSDFLITVFITEHIITTFSTTVWLATTLTPDLLLLLSLFFSVGARLTLVFFSHGPLPGLPWTQHRKWQDNSLLRYLLERDINDTHHIKEESWRYGSRGGAVVRALAFHQCGPGSIPGFYAICGLSLLVLYSAWRVFFPGTPVFSSSQKPTFSGVAQLASARLSEQGVPSSILSDFNVCFDFPLIVVAIALYIRETEHWEKEGGKRRTIGFHWYQFCNWRNYRH